MWIILCHFFIIGLSTFNISLLRILEVNIHVMKFLHLCIKLLENFMIFFLLNGRSMRVYRRFIFHHHK